MAYVYLPTEDLTPKRDQIWYIAACYNYGCSDQTACLCILSYRSCALTTHFVINASKIFSRWHFQFVGIFQLQINKKLWSVTVFTNLICCSRKKGFRHLYTFTIKALTYTNFPVQLAHASIFWKRKTQRSLIRGCGTSINRVDISCESSAGRWFTWSIKSY